MTENILTNVIIKLEKKYKSGKDYVLRGDILDTLIATKLSQNTTDKTSYIAYKNLKIKYKRWEDLLNANLKDIKKEIKICGMADTKAKDIKDMIAKMKKKYGNIDLNFLKKYSTEKVYAELLQYRGIGIKTVSCVLAFSLGREVFPVDTHVHRIMNRIGIVKTKSPEETFKAADKKVPGKKKLSFHKNLIKFGREICKSTKPLCGICLLYKYCGFENKEQYHNSKLTNIKNDFLILDNLE